MDPVTLGMARATAERMTTAETFAHLTSRLSMGNEDAVLTVLGDSTGNETTEWVYLVAQWIATQYPAYTVNYRLFADGSKTYDAAVTIQTGTGSKTLTIYNGSVAGQDASYSVTNFATQVTVAPHLVIVNYSHNAGSSTDYRPVMYALTRRIHDEYPQAAIVLTAQNPTAPTYGNHAAGLTRCQQVMDLAASEGYGLINATQAFLNVPSYEDTLLNVDELHPTAAGSALWANLVKSHLRKSVGIVPRAVTPRPSRMFISAERFLACEGSPTLAVHGDAASPFPAWSLDAASVEAVVTQVDWPNAWQNVNIYGVYSVAGSSGFTGTTVAKMEAGIAQSYNTAVFPSPSVQSIPSSPQNLSSALRDVSPSNTGFAYQTIISRFPGPEFVTYKSRPMALRIRRNADDAADLLAEDLLFRGVVIERYR